MIISAIALVYTISKNQTKKDEQQNLNIATLKNTQDDVVRRVDKLETWKEEFTSDVLNKLDDLKTDIHNLEIRIIKALKEK